MLSGLVRQVDPSQVVAVVNTGDDFSLHGLHISPDLDTVTYTLAGVSNQETGWGRRDESWRVMESLAALGGETWFALGDRDLGTHLYRTARLAEGASLDQVTAELSERWGLGLRILPMSNDPVRTRLTLRHPPPGPSGHHGREVAFQDYFVRLGHSVPVEAVRFQGAEVARPAPGMLDALEAAHTVVICPSNPVVSVGPILAVPGVRDLLARRRHDVVAVSPIVAGAALKGPADRLLAELGLESSVVGVARYYADVAGTLVVDDADADLAHQVETEGLRCMVAPTIMSTPDRADALARLAARLDRPTS